MSSALPPWVPNPVDIEDGQFLQWDATTGRFNAVDEPGGAEIEAINAADVPYQFQSGSFGSPIGFNFDMEPGLSGDRYLIQFTGAISNNDVVNPTTVQAELLLSGVSVVVISQDIANAGIGMLTCMGIGTLVADDPAPNINIQFLAPGAIIILSSGTLSAIKL